jgi:hypothetical protein
LVICILSIFVKRFIMKNLFLLLIFILVNVTLFAQVPTPNVADGQIVCPNAVHFYGDQVVNPTSTYTFSIVPAQAFTTVGQQIQVTWVTPGVYTMTMTETNAAGCQFVTVAQITVQPNVIATIDPIVICQDGADVVITGQNLGTNPVFNGPGVSGNVFDPTGLAPGIYNITVTSQTANGCSITGTGTATVEPLPTGIIYTD